MSAIIVDPDLIAAITRQFNLRGDLKPFNLTEDVVPIFDIGRLIDLTPIAVTTPGSDTAVRVGTETALTHLAVHPAALDSGITFTSRDNNPAGGTVLADTGQLAAGPHLIYGLASGAQALDVQFSWRNAADAADIDTWTHLAPTGGPDLVVPPFVANITVNERFVFRPVVASVGLVATSITAAPLTASIA